MNRYKSAAVFTLTLGLNLCFFAGPAAAYIHRGDLSISPPAVTAIGVGEQVNITVTPCVDTQLPGCQMEECPAICGEKDCIVDIGNGLVDCCCEGFTSQEYQAAVDFASDDGNVLEAVYDGYGNVVVTGLSPGVASVSVSAALREWGPALETFTFTVNAADSGGGADAGSGYAQDGSYTPAAAGAAEKREPAVDFSAIDLSADRHTVRLPMQNGAASVLLDGANWGSFNRRIADRAAAAGREGDGEDEGDGFVIEIATAVATVAIPYDAVLQSPAYQRLLQERGLSATTTDIRVSIKDISGDETLGVALAEQYPRAALLSRVVVFEVEVLNAAGESIGSMREFAAPVVNTLILPRDYRPMPPHYGALGYDAAAKTFTETACKYGLKGYDKHISLEGGGMGTFAAVSYKEPAAGTGQ